MRHNNSRNVGNAINLRMLCKVLGQLLLVETAFMVLPLLVCLANRESDAWAFVIVMVITAMTGAAMNFLSHPRYHILRRRDGLLLASVAWVAFSLFGMLPFILCETRLNVSEAFFEAMSGFTTTGATVIRDVESCGKGILLWRALTQWIGGLGIILFTLTFIPTLNNSSSLMMFHAEATGITHDKLGARIAKTARRLWSLYAMLTILLVAVLWAGPMDLFDSVCHAATCISTGGFSTHNESIAAFESPYVMAVLSVFMFIGGISFSLIISAFRYSWKVFLRNDVFKTYVMIVAVFYVFIVFAIVNGGQYKGWQSITVDPLFHIVSALTSTGFGAGNYEGWGFLALTMTFFMMFVGACAGSTTGGLKIDRFLFLVKNMLFVMRRYVRPRLMKTVNINGQSVEPEKANEIVAYISLFTILIVIGGVVLVAQGFPIVDAFFSSVSCVANNGLGAGVTGITGSYDFLPSSGKWLMSFLMLAGRLEIISLIAVFSPSFWRAL
ncbi:MAG: TrkH family potassium uptake protein [Prevotella sp.]|nr:TrkH family potassium uptake protein [Prevotella sp.]